MTYGSSMSARVRVAVAIGLAGVMQTAGCGDDGPAASECVDRDASACMPLYEPTWDRVYSETIAPSCTGPGMACHSSAEASGAGGGFVVSDQASTHAALLDNGFVEPGDESCSALMFRLDTTDTTQLMPPGSQPLAEGERCAVAQWIADGAQP